jgi:hypothetical protein
LKSINAACRKRKRIGWINESGGGEDQRREIYTAEELPSDYILVNRYL